MNEQMIFNQISQLSFQNMMKGMDNETAVKEAEKTVKLMIQTSKKISEEASK
jgi:hypothetical protein